MSWAQVFNDVTSRISAASPNLQTTLNQYARPPAHSFASGQACHPISPDDAMSVRVQLDRHNADHYTNLDFISGRVMLSLATDTTISAITVKLEGESRTKLAGPKFPGDPRPEKRKVEQEIHKLLYKVQTVFPGPDISQNAVNAQFTLPMGQYSYPFSFKIPINNDCLNNTRISQDLKLGSFLGPDLINLRHTKQTLPPVVGPYVGKADIQYFIKATIVRPKFYQGNIRSQINFPFIPIEPPRPLSNNEETFARRQHQFPPTTSSGRKASLFTKAAEPIQHQSPSFKVEARLPNPAILTCLQSLPLKLWIERTNDSPATLYLNMLHIQLTGYTNIRAREFTRKESENWVIMSQANINLPLDGAVDKTTRALQIPSHFWNRCPLLANVIPSFETCNISRNYELEVRIGVTYGMSDGMRPEPAILPLVLPVQVFSGIAPPQQLLNRVNSQQTQEAATPIKPDRPQSPASPLSPSQTHLPPRPNAYTKPAQGDLDDAPPPSYEDAMADDIAPVDGPRRNFDIPEATNNVQPTYNPDSKSSSGGLQRHPSERLFSQNAPSPPSAGGRRSNLRNSEQLSGSQTVEPPDTVIIPDLISGLDVSDGAQSTDNTTAFSPTNKSLATSQSREKKG